MKGYVGAGLDPARFWDITPRLMALEMDGARLREQRARELTWFGAMLPNLKKIPTLRDFAGYGPAPAQTPEQVDANIRTLAAAWGARKGNP